MATPTTEIDVVEESVHHRERKPSARELLGRQIERYRRHMIYTQRTLADAVGLTTQNVADLENGARSASTIALAKLERIAEEFFRIAIVQWDGKSPIPYDEHTTLGALWRAGAKISIASR